MDPSSERRQGERRQDYTCEGCDHVRRELSGIRAELDTHIEWASRAERLHALEKRMEEQDRHYRELRTVDEQARALAAARLSERLDDMNELRAQLTTERGLYITRVEFDAEHRDQSAIRQRLVDDSGRRFGELERWRAGQEASRLMLQRASAIVGAVAGALAGVLGNLVWRR